MPVAIDERGIDVDALVATDVRAVILTPTHQFPTGNALAPERRQALVSWANERRATIIEDDYDAEFRYDRDPVGALQGLAPDRVALIGTVSKSLAPAMRLGWVVCPPALLDSVIEDKRLGDRGSPALEQLALASLIESGRFDRHLRHMRAVYAARRDTLVAALAARAPELLLQWSQRRVSRRCPPARWSGRAGGHRAGSRALGRAPWHELLPHRRRRRSATARAGLREPQRDGD